MVHNILTTNIWSQEISPDLAQHMKFGYDEDKCVYSRIVAISQTKLLVQTSRATHPQQQDD